MSGVRLSLEQERALLLLTLHGPSPVFQRTAAAWLDGDGDEARGRSAVRCLAVRHELLRATLVAQDGSLVQAIAPVLTDIPLTTAGCDGDEQAALRLARDEAARQLDPRGEPAWRVVMIHANGRWLLVLTAHAMIADEERTAHALLAELLALIRSNEELPPCRQYREYALAQEDALRREGHGEDVAWWRARLEGAPRALEGLGDRPPPAVRSLAGAEATRRLAATAALERLAADTESEPSVVALAGLVAVLHRYTGQPVVVIGFAVEQSDALGPIGEPVPLHITVDAGTDLRTLIGRTAGEITEARAHGALAFMCAARQVQGGSSAPLFQVRFRGRSRTGASFEVPRTCAAYELELGLDVAADGTRELVATFSTDLFDHGTVERLLEHWEILLAGGAAEPERPVSALLLLAEAERRRLVVEWNATAVPLPPDVRVHALFEAQVDRTPDAIAAVFGESSLSYAELELQANRLARRLIAAGVGPDVPVGLRVERSLDLVVGVLGILKAGGAYVPIDPAYPVARAAWILADVDAPVLVTQSALSNISLSDRARVVLVDAEDDTEPDCGRISAANGAGDLAYLIYTSGSTGRPKGIGLPHVALTNLIEWHARTLLGGARTLQFASISFDASFHEMFAAFRTGGEVHLVPDNVRRDITALAAAIHCAKIEKVIFPVVVLQRLAEEYVDQPQMLASLREVTTTGEQMHITAPVIALFKRLPGVGLHNHYGPSESHVVTSYTLAGDPDQWVSHPPIGRPIDNCRILVLDAHMNPCPIGVPGELYIGGVCLARGYWNRLDLTAERFVRDPFSEEPSARLYRTGDVARVRADGEIEYLGRRDDQVKIRGVRVELGEVESVISHHPSVQAATVLAREDGPGAQRLVAYVVARGGGVEAGWGLIAELRALLRQTLPEVMVPAAIVPMDALPLTANGKVDRRALPAPEAILSRRSEAVIAPRSEIEAALLSIWREVLRAPRIGVHDDFFALGGHSLAATQVFSRIRRIFNVDVTFQQLFAAPTIAGLAATIRARRAPAAAAAAIEPTPRGTTMPLSPAQERMWFMHRLAPDSTAYSCPYFFLLRGPLEAAALEQALADVVQRHEALRTRFVEQGGRPRQVIAACGQCELERADLRELSRDEREAALGPRFAAEAARPFDLEHGPLLRAGLVELAGDEHALWLNAHHIVIDGWSMDVLLRDLAAAYAARRRGVAPELAPLAVQFADWAAWQSRRADESAVTNMLAWWKRHLANAPELSTLPTDRPRPPVQSSRGGAVRLRLEPGGAAALRELGMRRGATLTMVLLASFVALLHRYTGEDDLVVGLPVAGRDRVELEPVVGLFVNTLPIRVDASGDPSFAELLDRVRRACLDAYDRDAAPFDRLVQELRPERDLSHGPLVQIGFAPQPVGERDLRLADLEVEEIEVDAQKTIFDLTLYVWENANAVEGMFEYSADLFDRATIERAREHLLALLVAAGAEPERPVSRVPLLTSEQRRRLLAWSCGAPPAVTCERVHELFTGQITADPERPAVILGPERLSYAALERRANQLANFLRGRGVGPGTLVAIGVERSFELVVAVLATLKAGAAFVPLDPGYPPDRLAFMLADCAAAVLLTQARLAARFAMLEVVLLDADWPEIARESERPPDERAGPDHAAYVIYTSGSTGRPKGVVIEHRGAVNLAHAHKDMFELSPVSVVLQFAALSFDAFVWELLIAWSAGAALCLVPPNLAPDAAFLELLRAERVSLCVLPPSLLAALPHAPLPDLTHVIAGGEACSAEVVARWAPGRRFINAYGPTEATICATSARCEPGDRPPPIGRPLAGVHTYVLDRHGEPTPIGVPGELYIGGAGVGRGYLGRPELTRERFIDDPFAGTPGARMYRTGDRVRWRSDGQLEFLGRLDHQIKLRGFRIELGEVEAALRAHPGVQDVAVVTRPDLVAYAVPRGAAVSAEERGLQVETWRALYDDTYERTFGDGMFDITGWVSSYTGLPIPEAAMQAWRDASVERLAALRAGQVWEIGCGTGLLLLPLAARCRRYVATDLSATAIAHLRARVDALGLHHVSLERRAADDLRGFSDSGFDLVIVHSVAQYFPDATYLRGVLAAAAARVVDGGVVFIGDVRGLGLLPAFHASVQLAQAPADAPAARVRERALRAVGSENELVIDPRLFAELAVEGGRVGHVEVWLRRGAGDDEMTRFRYDALLFVGDPPPLVVVEKAWSWQQLGSLAELERTLECVGGAVEVLDVPNARVAGSVAAIEHLLAVEVTAGAVVSAAAKVTATAVDPESLWVLGQQLGLAVRVTFARSGDPAAVDVLFERGGDSSRLRAWSGARPLADGRAGASTNNPVQARLQRQLAPALREFMQARLPAFMVPSAIVLVEALPALPNGKVDRRALTERAQNMSERTYHYVHPRSEIERALAEIWREVLGVDRVGIDDPFFELGGHSLLLAQVRAAIAAQLGCELAMVDLFRHPTIRTLAAHLAGHTGAAAAGPARPAAAGAARPAPSVPADSVAIVGVAGRFPGAPTVEALWANLSAGVESITSSTADELAAATVDPALLASSRFVPAFGVLNDAFCFDAAFFGFSPQEARLLDPQHRVFLECAHAALEDAACDPARGSKRVGVFGGCDAPRWWLQQLGGGSGGQGVDEFQASISNVPDNLTARVAHKLDLRGPAITVLTGCSTSLVALHLACQSLRAGECDVALAGGSAVAPPAVRGHLYHDGAILSPDGHCRPFDADARGTVGASGVAIVVLKRLADALADGDAIRAIVRGSAIGNDGASKIGFTAPGLRGQVDVVARAQAAAGVDPGSVGLIEAHGTATRLGDPIEVAALTEVFRAVDRPRSCALGSLKGNLGHLGAAAGITGLIKAILALERRQIPPTLHFRRPNPELRLDAGPFFVPTTLLPWEAPPDHPRRAGVSAFGVGGTNAHVVLEEAPTPEPGGAVRPWQILVMSARTGEALAGQASALARHLRDRDVPPADAAFTLQQRPALAPVRRAIVYADREQLLDALGGRRPAAVVDGETRPRAPRPVFVFPGGGTHHVGMGRELYAHEPAFREQLDACAAGFVRELGEDIRPQLFAAAGAAGAAATRLLQPSLNMAAIFAVEVALARLLIAWGVRPIALFGHSLGEYAAVHIAGGLSLDDAVALVATRGRLCDAAPDGAMLVVPLSVTDAANWLTPELAIAAVNATDQCVISGSHAAIEALAAAFARAGVDARLVPISTSSHSPLMDPLAPRLVARARTTEPRPLQIPVVSGVTGTWSDGHGPEYWGEHLRRTVRFADGLDVLLADPDCCVIEVGPGAHLTGLVRRHRAAGPQRIVAPAMPPPRAGLGELEGLLLALGAYWCAGGEVDWDAFAAGQRRRRTPLPTYPFARVPHLINAPPVRPATPASQAAPAGPTAEIADDLTRAVADIWSRVLGVGVRPGDNFFALGGTSLSAIQLRARLLDELGFAAPVHALVEQPTLAGFVASLGAAVGAARPASLLVRLREGRADLAPLFLVQPIGGTVYTYRALARRLRTTAPVIGIRASGFEPGEPVLEDIEAIASRYLAEIAAVQQTGPYRIAGHSAGGVIAYEMARQLAARGESATLLMLDAPSLPAVRRQSVAGADDVLRALAPFASTSSAAYQGFVAALAESAGLRSIVLATWRALARYEPEPLSAALVYIAAAEQRDARDARPWTYWLELANAPYSLHQSPGDHFTIIDEPAVERLARLIDMHLEP